MKKNLKNTSIVKTEIEADLINCDNCGKVIKGEKYQIVNECFVPQRGLYHCGCVFKPLRNKHKKI